jgi:hypothetical protein
MAGFSSYTKPAPGVVSTGMRAPAMAANPALPNAAKGAPQVGAKANVVPGGRSAAAGAKPQLPGAAGGGMLRLGAKPQTKVPQVLPGIEK